mgnify:CR=1 FL=1
MKMLIKILALLLMIGTQAWSNEVSTLQKQLRILGYDPGAIDGLWGGLTQNALQKFLLQQGQSFDGVLDRNEFQLLETELKKQGIEIRASGNWNYRATSISFGGYDRADQPVYDAIKTIKNIPDFGFNVLTIDFRCTGTIGLDDRNRRWDEALAILGGKAPAPKKTSKGAVRTLRKGMQGDDVKKMQNAIGVTADGDFGFGTLTAVKKWQKMNGLTADGIVGPATQAKMFS